MTQTSATPPTHLSDPSRPSAAAPDAPREATRLSELTPQQWKSGIAAWLGWLFDGLDMHLYVLVATPFVAILLQTEKKDPAVGYYGSWIQAAFMFGWALGGGFFGRVADRIGRSRGLTLTILTYASFTGLSFFAQTWWQLMIFRFLAALGIGGEWAVGSALLSETWPKRWRPWMAAVLQTGVNLGVMLATMAFYFLAGAEPKYLFLVGIIPALMVLWIRRAVPEPEEWHAAKSSARENEPGFADLFRGTIRRTTLLTIAVCSLSLTAHWAFLFWCQKHLRDLPELAGWDESETNKLVASTMGFIMASSIAGNFLAAALARFFSYRRSIALLCLGYFAAIFWTYVAPRELATLRIGFFCIGICQGVFALFTMYLPPLFPTLLRTTGAGFCYNVGRIASGLGIVFFGLFNTIDDPGVAIYYAGFLFLPAAAISMLLPEPSDMTPLEPLD